MSVRLISFYGFLTVAIFSLIFNAAIRLGAGWLTARNPDSSFGAALGALA